MGCLPRLAPLRHLPFSHSCTTSYLDVKFSKFSLLSERSEQLGKVTAKNKSVQVLFKSLTFFKDFAIVFACHQVSSRKRVQSYKHFPDPPNFSARKCVLEHNFNIHLHLGFKELLIIRHLQKRALKALSADLFAYRTPPDAGRLAGAAHFHSLLL